MSKTVAFALTVVVHPSNGAGGEDCGRDRFLLVHEKEKRGWWLPGGGVDAGQTLQEAAVREAKEEAGLDVVLTGVLRIDHHTPCSGRLRVIFLAQPVSAAAADELKTSPDQHSRGARWVTLSECAAIESGELWRSYDDIPMETCHLRGPEPLQWFTHVACGGGAAPMSVLQTCRLGELPQLPEDEEPARAFLPTVFLVELLVVDGKGRALLGDGETLPRLRCDASLSLYQCAAALARSQRVGVRVRGITAVRYTLDLRTPTSVFGVAPAGTATVLVTYAATPVDPGSEQLLTVVIEKEDTIGMCTCVCDCNCVCARARRARACVLGVQRDFIGALRPSQLIGGYLRFSAGLTFGKAWPILRRLDSERLHQVAHQSEDVYALHVGCRLLSVNGVAAGGLAFADAKKLVGERPLTLVFAEAEVSAGGAAAAEQPDLATLRWRSAGSLSRATLDLVSLPAQPLSLIGLEKCPPVGV